MKKYTNKILIITIIGLFLTIITGYSVDFQKRYRKGEIKYKKQNVDSLKMVIKDALETDSTAVFDEMPLQNDEIQAENEVQKLNI